MSHTVSQERRKIAWSRINPQLKALATEEYIKRESNLFGPGFLEKATKRQRKPYPRLPAKAEVGLHLLKGLDLRMTEAAFAVYQGAHLLSTAAGKYSASSRTAPTPGFRAQSIANGQRVSEISQVPASQKPTSNRTLYIPTTTVTLLGTSFTQISTLECLPSAGRLPVCICN